MSEAAPDSAFIPRLRFGLLYGVKLISMANFSESAEIDEPLLKNPISDVTTRCVDTSRAAAGFLDGNRPKGSPRLP